MISRVRCVAYLGAALIACLPFASCTCQRDLPEPPKLVARKSGFGASLPTPRRERAGVPERGVIEKRRVEPRGEPTLPASDTPAPPVAELPEDFPDDVPLMEDAELFAVQELAGDARNVIFRADRATPEIFNYYLDSMQAKGWNVAQEYQRQEQAFLSFRKGQMITNMTIAKDPNTGKQVVAIMYYEEKELPFPEF